MIGRGSVTVIVLALACSSCFTSWALTQAVGGQRALDERVREETVPLPEVRERLQVRLPLAIELDYPPAPAPGALPASPPPQPTERPFALRCESTQAARDTVYHSAFRYGSKWKKLTAAMVLIEAGLASAYYFGTDRQKPEEQLAVGFFGLDALGTAVLFFVPRKEIYRADVRPVTTHLRSDCPAGLVLEIAGESYKVDAAGGIGELGLAALDAWMQNPNGALRAVFEDRTIDLPIRAADVCTWNQARRPGPQLGSHLGCGYGPREVFAILEVPLGTLTRIE